MKDGFTKAGFGVNIPNSVEDQFDTDNDLPLSVLCNTKNNMSFAEYTYRNRTKQPSYIAVYT